MLGVLAWRNIWRNRNRSLITMASIAGAVMLSVVTVSLQKGVWDNLVRNVVSLYTGYVQVHGKGFWDEQTLDNSFEVSDSALQTVLHTEGVTGMSPRIEAFALASVGEKTRGCLAVGIEPEAEDRLTHLRAKITSGHFIKDGSDHALVAEGLAEKLHLSVGDTLVLLSQGYFGSTAAGQYQIAGILHFGSPELNESVCYLSLQAARYWLDAPDRATALALSLDDPRNLGRVQHALKAALPQTLEVMTWEEMMPEIVQHIKTDTAGMYIFIGVLYLLISFGIFSTLLMMLSERQREFGMLVALGMRKGKIAAVVLMESVFLTLTGSLAGLLLSWPVVWYLTEYPIRIGGEFAKIYERFGFEAVFPATVYAPIFIEQTLVVLGVGLVLALYPALQILRLDPVAAMRK
ncbi:MAG: ABC transporter permease [Lewinellaceae bacterium]|nr:ABC transporter permease [Lewinellaceae bacterium]